jgi:hypothetical protein
MLVDFFDIDNVAYAWKVALQLVLRRLAAAGADMGRLVPLVVPVGVVGDFVGGHFRVPLCYGRSIAYSYTVVKRQYGVSFENAIGSEQSYGL